MDLLPFAQLEVAGRLAIDDGRYLVRPPGEPDSRPDVLAIRTLGAARARARLRRGRPVAVEPAPGAEPIPVCRLTLIKSVPFDDEPSARRWLARVGGDSDLSAALAHDVAATANRALEAHRVAAPDPYAADLDPGTALVVRFGFGAGEEVAEGRWSAAVALPESRRRGLRSRAVDGVGAQERIAAVLGGRDSVEPSEALLLDAERAWAQGRLRLAAIVLESALGALPGAPTEPGDARALAAAARRGEPLEAEPLRAALRAGRRAIRAATAGGESA